ncbi:MAG: flagella accessory protein C [Halodesulfurarchaeum sp.]
MILVDSAPLLPEFFSLGLMGVGMVSWLGDDGAEEVDQDAGEMDDEFELEDDEFGDFDGLDGMDEENGANTTELEGRIEDLENEVANVSSTANTVRSENEQIGEQVQEVEENVRKLLEIYEMVTRGVNPFVDDVSPEAGLGGGGSDFGLFGTEDGDGEQATEEDLGSDIADADAEEFFDDDAFDEEFDEDFEEGEEFVEEFESDDDLGGDFDDTLEEGFEDSGFEDEAFGDGAFEEEMDGLDANGADGSEDEGSGGGTSFEELKEEYESGEADWAEDDILETEDSASEPAEPDSEAETDVEDPEGDSVDLFRQDDLEADEDTADLVASEDAGGAETASDTETTMEGEPADTAATSEGDSPRDFQFGAATATPADGGPHLSSPPAGYLADVVLMEWLADLLEEFGPRNTMRAINHYERIGWIGEATGDHCYAMIQGLTDGREPFRDETGPTNLSMADHRRSLRYVEELAAGHLEREVGERLSRTDGVQR